METIEGIAGSVCQTEEKWSIEAGIRRIRSARAVCIQLRLGGGEEQGSLSCLTSQVKNGVQGLERWKGVGGLKMEKARLHLDWGVQSKGT